METADLGLEAWVLNVVFIVEDVANRFGFSQYAASLNGGVVYPFGVALEEEWANERLVEGHDFETSLEIASMLPSRSLKNAIHIAMVSVS